MLRVVRAQRHGALSSSLYCHHLCLCTQVYDGNPSVIDKRLRVHMRSFCGGVFSDLNELEDIIFRRSNEEFKERNKLKEAIVKLQGWRAHARTHVILFSPRLNFLTYTRRALVCRTRRARGLREKCMRSPLRLHWSIRIAVLIVPAWP